MCRHFAKCWRYKEPTWPLLWKTHEEQRTHTNNTTEWAEQYHGRVTWPVKVWSSSRCYLVLHKSYTKSMALSWSRRSRSRLSVDSVGWEEASWDWSPQCVLGESIREASILRPFPPGGWLSTAGIHSTHTPPSSSTQAGNHCSGRRKPSRWISPGHLCCKAHNHERWHSLNTYYAPDTVLIIFTFSSTQ